MSMMLYSMFLMVTALSTRPATHEPSHGAGQTRPVNSGKLFVDDRFTYALCHCSVSTMLLNSGMRLLMGQPVCAWQKGVPQSMQRAAWRLSSRGSCVEDLEVIELALRWWPVWLWLPLVLDEAPRVSTTRQWCAGAISPLHGGGCAGALDTHEVEAARRAQ